MRDVDLNLLRLFAEVYRAGSVSRAAERLSLTQPAVSHGLTRLRLLVKDPLFMRAPGGVRPTPRAVALADATNLTPTPTVDSTTGIGADGHPYLDVTVNYQFKTIANFVGVPKTVNVTRTVRMRIAPKVPKNS